MNRSSRVAHHGLNRHNSRYFNVAVNDQFDLSSGDWLQNQFTNTSDISTPTCSESTATSTEDVPLSASSCTETSSSSWSISKLNQGLLKNLVECNISTKTRGQIASMTIDERLYATLKYQLSIQLSQSSFINCESRVLHAQIRLINASDDSNITQIDGKDALHGTIETILTLHDSVYTGKLAIQVCNALSYHRIRQRFYFRIDIFLASDLENAIVSFNSRIFKIYARKANKKNYSLEKRKREDEGNGTSKRQRVESSSSESFEKFRACLGTLNGLMNDLSDEERIKAKDLLKRMTM